MDNSVPEETAFTHPQAASQQSTLAKPFWSNLIGPPWAISLVFFALVTAVRFFAFFSPYSLQELFFLQAIGLWALPFVILTAAGRRQIGLTTAGTTTGPLLVGALAGAACGLVFFGLGTEIYGNSANNWDLSIRAYLHIDDMRGLMSPVALFALYAMPAMFLNPIGDEILFRGFMQESFSSRFNRTFATLVSSLLFGLLYLYLHGIWRDSAGFHLHLGSAALAVALMAMTGLAFSLCRALSGSLWAAIVAHAAFNLAILAQAIHRFSR